MSPVDLSAGVSWGVGFTLASGPVDVKWIRPGAPTPMSSSPAQKGTDHVNALIVIVLTLACTVLSLFDLFLLASGS
jgi:hypothetical protein